MNFFLNKYFPNQWQKDKQQLDIALDHRLSIANSNHTNSNSNVNSKLIIQQTSRLDSALYTCEAKNEFGADETNIQLIVTGKLLFFCKIIFVTKFHPPVKAVYAHNLCTRCNIQETFFFNSEFF